ncbi:hypothetical protein [Salegentibacter sp. Hel_I_6]|uniref:hypothetical protein n=1 Tax=Salegentibacter sp. Hel_I_6 TaxID=1250278 RepID=UPI00055C3BC5|nr:hypothetical protein [Salegentibacter sp. Hel_I_6]
MKTSRLKNYSFEEILLLKSLASHPDDVEYAVELIEEGLDKYASRRLSKMVDKFQKDGILKCGIHLLDENRKVRVIFNGNFQKMILNEPNPVPENIKSDIDVKAIIEKLSCSNLDLTEVHYLTTLLKKDAVTQF